MRLAWGADDHQFNKRPSIGGDERWAAEAGPTAVLSERVSVERKNGGRLISWPPVLVLEQSLVQLHAKQPLTT